MTDQRADLASFHEAVLMDDMMETVGVEQFSVVDLDGGQSYLRARANCHACSCKAACRDWLADNPEGDPQPFCPNADLFLSIKS